MAITKNHPINSTLNKAIAYICNPDKTDNELLVFSYGCSPETADLEFEWTRQKAAEPYKGKCEHLARHFIQAFSPDETSPEQAHEIGKRLADEMLGGKYEYVLTTHIDKGHIHNHIIFNDVSFVDYTRSHINKQWYYKTRRISDRLCDELGLSVIPASQNKGKSYVEYAARKNGTSWKAKLMTDIDKAISRSASFEDFVLRLEVKGYEVKQGKHISFRPKDKERFVRGKTLGYKYTKEKLQDRIAKNKIHQPRQAIKGVNLIIDIENCIKAQQNKGYEHWAKIHNLKQASQTLNFLSEHDIKNYNELDTAISNIHNKFSTAATQIKEIEKEINQTAILIKNLETYIELKPIYSRYQKSNNKTLFQNKYHREITLFEAAAKHLPQDSALSINSLKTNQAKLAKTKSELYQEYKALKRQATEIDIIKNNVNSLLNMNRKPKQEKNISLE